MNRYSYVQGDPVNFVDPSGLNKSAGGGWSCSGTWSAERTPEGRIVNFRITSSHCVTWSGRGGGALGAQPDLQKLKDVTECDLFAAELAKVAFNTEPVTLPATGGILNYTNPLVENLRRRFAPEGYEDTNTEFASGGFKEQFRDPYSLSLNQARHYVGALRASIIGGPVGEAYMNRREKGSKNDSPEAAASHQADLALNRVAFRHANMLKSGQVKITDLHKLILKDVCK